MCLSIRVLVAGVPYHAIDNNPVKMIKAALQVVIVEQTGTDERVAGAPGRALEMREVVRRASPNHVPET